MALTPAQNRCATTFDRSIAVIAGAGSGKTMTLKERIANAFFPNPETGEDAVVGSIDEVLAITFTEKAAAELRGRVRQVLRSRGLADQAMLVDGAWIGTIHGMCSRILKENALALGIDPAFEVISEEVRSQLLDEASEFVLCNDKGCRTDIAALFGEYKRDTLKKMIENLIESAARSPQRFDSIQMPKFAIPVTANLDESLSSEQLYEQRLIAASHLLAPLLRVARTSYERFCRRKLELGYMDNDDLLLLAHDALSRDDIRRLYADRFKLVMIDEFQDTDSMQLEIIRSFTGADDERLCVVGDPQQSIYRFRGADLSVCEGHLASVRATTGEQGIIKLADNFRSHRDILDFVDIAFGPEGQEREDGLPNFYQRLVYGRNEEWVKPSRRWDASQGPRVMIQEVQHAYRRIEFGRALSCELVAKRLREIHDASDRPWGDMAILLSAMTHANDYARALDAQGIPWVISGGSVFKDKGDALLMAQLAAVLGNPRDSDALHAVLKSDIFGLTAEDLVAFGVAVGPYEIEEDGEKKLRETCFSNAFAQLLLSPDEEDGKDAPWRRALSERTLHAISVLKRAIVRVGRDSVPDILETVLAESGWLARMGESDSSTGEGEAASVGGRARAANALKAIRIGRDLEAKGALGARELSWELLATITESKETPGVLSAEDSNFVRIMTVHASKGLQFPVVVAAELTSSGGGGGKTPLSSSSSGSETQVMLDLQNSLQDGTALDGCKKKAMDVRKRHAMCPEDASLSALVAQATKDASLVDLADALRRYEAYQDEAELERKLYVAFTRAEEMLIVSMIDQVKTDGIEKALKSLEGDPLGVAELSRIAKSKAKGIAQEEKDDCKAELKRLREHVCLRTIEPNLSGVLARLAERREALEAMGAEYRLVTSPEVERWASTGELPHVADPASRKWEEGEEVPFDLADELPGAEEQPAAPFLVPEAVPASPSIRHAHRQAWSQGVLSASALHAAASEGVFPDTHYTGSIADEDIDDLPASATEKGTAFHTLGEIAAQRWTPGAELALPEDRVEPVCRFHGLNDEQVVEVRAAAERWFASPVAREMASHAHLVPEPPFFVELAPAERPIALNGFIDLLAYDEEGAGIAWVVDYKTGTFLDTDEKRRASYELQAMTYAYALLLQGFDEVRLSFVFVEQPDSDGMPQVCEFPAAGEPAWTLGELGERLAREVEQL